MEDAQATFRAEAMEMRQALEAKKAEMAQLEAKLTELRPFPVRIGAAKAKAQAKELEHKEMKQQIEALRVLTAAKEQEATDGWHDVPY